jgi:hypothetical protein
MVAEPPHTAPGCPHPGYVTTCPQARPVAPPPGGDEYPQNLLRHLPEEHVMARHLGHQTSVSSLLSHPQLVSPGRPHADVSLLPVALPAVVSRLLVSRRPQQLNLVPARCHICTYKQPNDSINIYTKYTCHAISKNHIYQNS